MLIRSRRSSSLSLSYPLLHFSPITYNELDSSLRELSGKFDPFRANSTNSGLYIFLFSNTRRRSVFRFARLSLSIILRSFFLLLRHCQENVTLFTFSEGRHVLLDGGEFMSCCQHGSTKKLTEKVAQPLCRCPNTYPGSNMC